jgi:hypothetical protein
MIQLFALLLTVPPVPHPPAERYAVAKKLLDVAPLPPSLKSQLLDRAVSVYSYSVMLSGKSDDYDRRRKVQILINWQVAGDDRFKADFDGCMIDAVGWRYDLPTLNDIEKALATPGGTVLWNENMIPTAEKCLGDTMPTFLQYTGYASALRWFSTNIPSGSLPDYVSGKTSLNTLSTELVAYCGVSTKNALTRRNEQLGIIEAWASKKRNSAAEACLVQSAMLAGYDLPILQTDGSTAKLIIAS